MSIAASEMFNVNVYTEPSIEKKNEVSKIAEVETLNFKDSEFEETLHILSLNGKILVAIDILNNVKTNYYKESEIEQIKSQF
jgi:hypothetical protein